jgi:hypothetical protein
LKHQASQRTLATVNADHGPDELERKA